MGHRKDRENFFSVPAADYEKKDGEIQARVNPAIGVVDQPFDGNPMINSVYDMILYVDNQTLGIPFFFLLPPSGNKLVQREAMEEEKV